MAIGSVTARPRSKGATAAPGTEFKPKPTAPQNRARPTRRTGRRSIATHWLSDQPTVLQLLFRENVGTLLHTLARFCAGQAVGGRTVCENGALLPT
jgi:hypothetical protein